MENTDQKQNTEQAFKEICSALSRTQDSELIEEFLISILTTAEMRSIANRWILVREIDKGTTQREIARLFGMSLCKITRGSKELKKTDSAFKQMIDIFNS